jgi:hypothetical protein
VQGGFRLPHLKKFIILCVCLAVLVSGVVFFTSSVRQVATAQETTTKRVNTLASIATDIDTTVLSSTSIRESPPVSLDAVSSSWDSEIATQTVQRLSREMSAWRDAPWADKETDSVAAAQSVRRVGRCLAIWSCQASKSDRNDESRKFIDALYEIINKLLNSTDIRAGMAGMALTSDILTLVNSQDARNNWTSEIKLVVIEKSSRVYEVIQTRLREIAEAHLKVIAGQMSSNPREIRNLYKISANENLSSSSIFLTSDASVLAQQILSATDLGQIRAVIQGVSDSGARAVLRSDLMPFANRYISLQEIWSKINEQPK